MHICSSKKLKILMEDEILQYQINNGDIQKIRAKNHKSETISNFFSDLIPDIDDKSIFLISRPNNKSQIVLNPRTQISKFLNENSGDLILIYTPQTFIFQDKKQIFHFSKDIKISDLKQKLKAGFKIDKDQNIKIFVKEHDDLNHFFNSEKRSFYKYIKPNLTYIITINQSNEISNDDYNYTNSAESTGITSNTQKPPKTNNENNTNNSDKKKPLIPNSPKKSRTLPLKKQPSEKVSIFSQTVNNDKKKEYSVDYQINNGQTRKISFPEKRGKTIFDIFSRIFPDLNEKQLLFVMVCEDQTLILLSPQSLIRDIIDNNSLLKIFTPFNFSYNQEDIQFSFKFSVTISELKQNLKDAFKIDKDKNIVLSVRDHDELNEQFNTDRHHFIKYVQPNLFFDITVDEFRFILINEIEGRNDRIEKVVDSFMTARRLIKEFVIENQLQITSGYILRLRFDENRYVLPSTVLANFKGESLELHLVKQSINNIVINGRIYKYAFDDIFSEENHPTVEKCKTVILQNYFFNNKYVNPDDLFFFTENRMIADPDSTMHCHHRRTLEVLIGYIFENRKNSIFYYPLEATVEEAKKDNEWSNVQNMSNGTEIIETEKLFDSCYNEPIFVLKTIKLYLDVNGYSCSQLFLENVTFKEVKELIVKDSILFQKLNENRQQKDYSTDVLLFFKSREIKDNSVVCSHLTSKETKIRAILRPLYNVTFELSIGTKFNESFQHGTKISEICHFLFEKYKTPYIITANSIPLKNERCVQDYIDQQPFLLRITNPSYFFILNGQRTAIQLRKSITSIEAKIHVMIVLLKKITNKRLFSFRVDGKKMSDYDILPSYKDIEIDLTPLKLTFIFNLPDLNKIYFQLKKENNNEEEEINDGDDKIIKINFSSTFSDVKKKISDILKNKKFELKFFYGKKELNDDLHLSEVHQENKMNMIKVAMCKKKITFISNEDESITEEHMVYLDEEVAKYKQKFLNEKVSNIKRIMLMTDDGDEIHDGETFYDYLKEDHFFYEIDDDKRFKKFEEEWNQFNNIFYLEMTIKDVRKEIEAKLELDNIRLIMDNKCLLNEVHLYEIDGFVTIEQNDKFVDNFLFRFEDCKYFKSIIPKLERKFTFAYDSTVDDARVVLEDILRKSTFTLVYDDHVIKDDEERLFTIGNCIFVRNDVLDDLGAIKPLLLITNINGPIVTEINLNLTVSQLISYLVQEDIIGVEVRKRNAKVIYRGKIINRVEKIVDFLNENDQSKKDPNSLSYNKSPIYIYFQKKVKVED